MSGVAPVEAAMDLRPAILVPAFSRPRSLERLLESLNSAVYPATGAELVISLDGGAAREVREIAHRFEFYGGTVRVVEHPRNLGLREHILWCGDQVFDREAVIVLEDDLVVDSLFYRFATEAINAYRDEPLVAGIALYGPRYNEISRLPFEPLYNGGSAYFMQAPCSWGQAWTRKQWSGFREWYASGDPMLVNDCEGLPVAVKAWPESSWKKFFASYLVSTHRYFVYPYHSYTTNCADPGGVHLPKGTGLFQVPLGMSHRIPEALKFHRCQPAAHRYDAFWEAEAAVLAGYVGLENDSLSVDIHGIKPPEIVRAHRLCVTSRRCSRPILKFPLNFRPIETNLRFPAEDGFLALCEVEHVDFEHPPDYVALALYYAYMPVSSMRFLGPVLLRTLRRRLGG